MKILLRVKLQLELLLVMGILSSIMIQLILILSLYSQDLFQMRSLEIFLQNGTKLNYNLPVGAIFLYD